MMMMMMRLQMAREKEREGRGSSWHIDMTFFFDPAGIPAHDCAVCVFGRPWVHVLLPLNATLHYGHTSRAVRRYATAVVSVV